MSNYTDYGLGCIPSEEDRRDYQFNTLINCAGNYPNEYLAPIPDVRLNQGNTMMCNAFALSMARYIYELNDSGNTKLFSPSYIYANRGDFDYKGEGMITRQSLNCLVKNGVCYVGTFNKLGTYSELVEEYKKNKSYLDNEAYPYRTSSYYALQNDNEIKQSILTTGCAIAAYNVYDNWYNVDCDGKIQPNYGMNHGGHCILLVGWTKNNEWIILNSWGRTWGDNGLGYIPMTIQKNEAWCILDDIQEVFFKSLKDCENHWAKTSINKAIQQGILKGYDDGTFKPDNPITRAEACAIIAKLDGYDNREYYSSNFKDVVKDDWFFNSVTYCYTHSRISGYPDGNFKPYNYLTRAEACKILSLVGKIKIKPELTNSNFADVNITHWACRFINAMVDRKFITGYEDNTFKPDKSITRAEFITIVDRMSFLNN